MNQSVFDELTELIDALRAETEASSITPERLGAILQRIVDILPELDDSSIADDAAAAIAAAQSAITAANSALAAAQSAESAVGDVTNQLAELASNVADAVEAATSAMSRAQTASAAAQQATSQVSQLASRVSTLESFKTSTESKLSKVPEYHSATWLDSEEGEFDSENPDRRQLVRYTSMLDAIEGGKKLIKKYNILANGIEITGGIIILSFVEVDASKAIKMSVYRVSRPSGANYCVVDKMLLPLPFYDATWAMRYGGGREQMDEFINVTQASPRCLMIADNLPIVWATRRNNDVVQFATMLYDGMRIYTVEYSSSTGETNTTYEDKRFIV
ncbi:MAG: hypothetical protein J6X22_04070 [Muribaculaceae bacterium]|nr:hypothetical protein [Muribaculaceae bacterium]